MNNPPKNLCGTDRTGKTIYTTIFSTIFYLGLFILLVGCRQNAVLQHEVVDHHQWNRIGPGGGGSTFIPTFSYQHSGTFIVRCDMTGAYLSSDGGETYSQVNFPGGSSSFAFDPVDPQVVYAGSKTLNRSVDGGKSWELLFPASSEMVNETFRGDHADYSYQVRQESDDPIAGSRSISNIKVDPVDNRVIYFSINDQLYVSENGGDDWQHIRLEERIEYIYTNNEDLSSVVLVLTGKGQYNLSKSDWSYTFKQFPENMESSFSFTGGMDSNKRTILYALSNDVSQRQHGGQAATSVWASHDAGNTWQRLESELLTNPGNSTPTYSKLSASEYQASVVYLVTSSYRQTLADGDTVYWYGTLKSEDGGKSWQWVWKGGGGSGQYAVKDGQDAANLEDAWVNEAFGGEYIRLIDVGVAPMDGDVAIVTDWYRTMKTIDGGNSWMEIYSKIQPDSSYISRGLDVTTAYGIHFDPHDPDHIAISYTDIGYHHSYNGGKSWMRSVDGIPPEWHNTCYWMVFDPEVKDKLWSVWSGLHDFPRGKMTRNPAWTTYGKGGVAISIDGGKTWKPSVDGMGFDSPATSIVLDPESPPETRTLYVAVYGKGVFKSIDGGMSWNLHNQGITGSLAAFELTLLPDGTLYLVTSPTPQHRNGKPGRVVFMGAVYRSTNSAQSWEKLDPGKKVLFPNGIAYDPEDPKILYLGAWGDIQLSDLIGGALARETGGNEWFDLDGGIFLSRDGGDNWTQIFDPEHYVYDVTVDTAHPGRLYCNTFDRGAYRSDDRGKTWKSISGYDFHWGHRVVPDPISKDRVYLTTYGSSVWHGTPEVN